MEKLTALLRLSRFGNLLIMTATLALSYYCLTDYLMPEDLLSLRFLALAACVVLTGAAGYIINDYHDVNIDLTNKPDKVVIGKTVSRRWAMLLHFVFNGMAILLGLMLAPAIGLSVMICMVLLWLYSVHFKKQFLSGNVLVAGLSAYVLVILPLFDPHISGYLVWSYALFAFGISLIREIVKDAEDMRGDSRFNCKTLPITLGLRKTRHILISLVSVYLLLLTAHILVAHSLIPFRHFYGSILYAAYMIAFVGLPLLATLYLLYQADVKHHFSRLSTLYKLIMLTGLLSMVIIKL